VVAILATILVMVMSRLFPAGVDRLEGVQEFVRGERAGLGRWTTGQKSTALAFGATVAMWVVPGVLLVVLGADHPASVWLRDRLPEGVAALIGAILLFLLPGDRGADGRTPRAMSWSHARIDWDIVLLGDVFYEKPLADAVARFAALASARGARIFAGDPKRSYFPAGLFDRVASYEVPVTRELEDAEIKRSTVWEWRRAP
jgi:sodium-dependent dicarboxylate transporter 2/3/5